MEYVRLAINKDYFYKILYNKCEKSGKINSRKLDSEIIVDAAKYGSIAKCMNHSCNHNCQITVQFANRILRLGVFSIRNTKANKELTFGYKQNLEANYLHASYYFKSKNYYGYLQSNLKLKLTQKESKRNNNSIPKQS